MSLMPDILFGPGNQGAEVGLNQGTINNTFLAPTAPSRPPRIVPLPRNEAIVDRPALFAELDQLLPPSTISYHSAALWGLGGSGKTQIALEYTYRRCQDPTCAVFWVQADDETTFINDYKTIGRCLGVSTDLSGNDFLTAVREHMQGLGAYLLVLDNADNLSLFGVSDQSAAKKHSETERPGSLAQFVPTAAGTVLWTSRDGHIDGSLVGPGRAVQVDRLVVEESRKLFETVRTSSIKDGEAHDVDALLSELEHLPLAITQAAAYLRRTQVSVRDYQDNLAQGQRRWKMLRKTEHDRHRQGRPAVSNSILETWNISIEHIRGESQVAYEVLMMLAFVDYRAIPDEMMRTAVALIRRRGRAAGGIGEENYCGSDEDQDDGEDDNDEENTIQVSTRLREFSFLSRHHANGESAAHEMHKLVQEALRYRLSQTQARQDQVAFAKLAFYLVDKLFPERKRELWDKCEMYVVHAQRVSDWGEVWGGLEETAQLLSKVSDYFYDRGRWREREPVDQRALGLRQEVLGDHHPDTNWSMAELAVTYHEQGRYDEAETIFVEVLGLRQEILGKRHPDTIKSMASLAVTYHAQELYDEAEKIFVEVLGLRQEILGKRHLDTISSMASLAATYHAQGRYGEAEEICVKVLKLRQELLGKHHPDTIKSMADLAATCYAQGRYGEAEEIKVKVLDLRQEILGKNHPDTIKSMADLAATCYAQGRYGEAEEIKVKVLGLRQEILGKNHPNTIKSMADLAATCYAQGRYDEAEEICIKVLKLRQEILGKRHPDTIKSMASLAVTYHAQERYDEAEKIFVEVLGLRQEILGKHHPDTILSMASLAATYHAQGRYGEAEEIKVKVLDLRQEVLGKRHPRHDQEHDQPKPDTKG